jgi:hypothetical protein
MDGKIDINYQFYEAGDLIKNKAIINTKTKSIMDNKDNFLINRIVNEIIQTETSCIRPKSLYQLSRICLVLKF